MPYELHKAIQNLKPLDEIKSIHEKDQKQIDQVYSSDKQEPITGLKPITIAERFGHMAALEYLLKINKDEKTSELDFAAMRGNLKEIQTVIAKKKDFWAKQLEEISQLEDNRLFENQSVKLLYYAMLGEQKLLRDYLTINLPSMKLLMYVRQRIIKNRNGWHQITIDMILGAHVQYAKTKDVLYLAHLSLLMLFHYSCWGNITDNFFKDACNATNVSIEKFFSIRNAKTETKKDLFSNTTVNQVVRLMLTIVDNFKTKEDETVSSLSNRLTQQALRMLPNNPDSTLSAVELENRLVSQQLLMNNKFTPAKVKENIPKQLGHLMSLSCFKMLNSKEMMSCVGTIIKIYYTNNRFRFYLLEIPHLSVQPDAEATLINLIIESLKLCASIIHEKTHNDIPIISKLLKCIEKILASNPEDLAMSIKRMGISEIFIDHLNSLLEAMIDGETTPHDISTLITIAKYAILFGENDFKKIKYYAFIINIYLSYPNLFESNEFNQCLKLIVDMHVPDDQKLEDVTNLVRIVIHLFQINKIGESFALAKKIDKIESLSHLEKDPDLHAFLIGYYLKQANENPSRLDYFNNAVVKSLQILASNFPPDRRSFLIRMLVATISQCSSAITAPHPLLLLIEVTLARWDEAQQHCMKFQQDFITLINSLESKVQLERRCIFELIFSYALKNSKEWLVALFPPDFAPELRAGKTPLNCAIESKNTEKIKFLLNFGANPNEANTNLENLEASKDKVTVEVKEVPSLVTQSLNVDIPIHHAIAQGDIGIIQLLIDRGANVKGLESKLEKFKSPSLRSLHSFKQPNQSPQKSTLLATTCPVNEKEQQVWEGFCKNLHALKNPSSNQEVSSQEMKSTVSDFFHQTFASLSRGSSIADKPNNNSTSQHNNNTVAGVPSADIPSESAVIDSSAVQSVSNSKDNPSATNSVSSNSEQAHDNMLTFLNVLTKTLREISDSSQNSGPNNTSNNIDEVATNEKPDKSSNKNNKNRKNKNKAKAIVSPKPGFTSDSTHGAIVKPQLTSALSDIQARINLLMGMSKEVQDHMRQIHGTKFLKSRPDISKNYLGIRTKVHDDYYNKQLTALKVEYDHLASDDAVSIFNFMPRFKNLKDEVSADLKLFTDINKTVASQLHSGKMLDPADPTEEHKKEKVRKNKQTTNRSEPHAPEINAVVPPQPSSSTDSSFFNLPSAPSPHSQSSDGISLTSGSFSQFSSGSEQSSLSSVPGSSSINDGNQHSYFEYKKVITGRDDEDDDFDSSPYSSRIPLFNVAYSTLVDDSGKAEEIEAKENESVPDPYQVAARSITNSN